MKLRVGSRESRLAVVQTQIVIGALRRAHPDAQIELVTMKTTGDKILDRTLDKVGGKGLFVKELDQALLEGRVDLERYRREQAGYLSLLKTWLTAIERWDDLMYGTDWPIVNLAEYIAFVQEIVPERCWESVFFQNANRIYGLGL